MAKLDSYWENDKNSNLNPKFGWQRNRFPIRRGVTIRIGNKNHSYYEVTETHVESIPANVFRQALIWPIDTGFVVLYRDSNVRFYCSAMRCTDGSGSGSLDLTLSHHGASTLELTLVSAVGPLNSSLDHPDRGIALVGSSVVVCSMDTF